MTAIEMVRKIQRAMRMPVSSGLDDQYSQEILECVNQAQRSLLANLCLWNELRVQGTVLIEADNLVHRISVDDKDLDIITTIQHIDGTPIEREEDEDFLRYSLTSGRGKPIVYRITRKLFMKSGAMIEIELAPTPDADYEVFIEGYCLPPKLLADTDEITLDEDIVYWGALMLAKNANGLDSTMESAIFTTKASVLKNDNGNWGEVELV